MFLTDLFFPKFCLNCGYLGTYLCYSCSKKLKPVNQGICFYCKKTSLFGLTHSNCTKSLNIDGLLCIYYYNPMLKKIIKNIKYRLAIEVWEEFYKTISPKTIYSLSFYRNISHNSVIQPIPLSRIKYNERGFNQASLISIFFQKILHFPIVDLLARKKETSAQAQMKNKKERYLNTKGSFTIKNSKDMINHIPTNIILVDDVITSGSTVKEATKVLKEAGVKKVYVMVLAKG